MTRSAPPWINPIVATARKSTTSPASTKASSAKTSSVRKSLVAPTEATLETIAGHLEQRQYLERAWSEGRLPHALLFHGPAAVGKRTCALALAKRICPKPNAPETIRTDAARRISHHLYPDVLMVEPSGATNQLTLAGWKPERDEPDGPQYYRFVECGPLEGDRKLLILRDAHRMNLALANYLLKLIEEPPSYLSIILTAHRRSDVLGTIRSRCAPLKFGPLALPEMTELAKHWLGPDQSQIRQDLLRRCSGRPGWLRQATATDPTPRHAQIALAMTNFNRLGFISVHGVASQLCPGGKVPAFPVAGAAEESYNELLAWFRDALMIKTLGAEAARLSLVYPTQIQALTDFATACTENGLDQAVQILQNIRPLTQRPMDPAFILEHYLTRIGPVLRT
jgi:hypothetical protein